MKVKYVTVKNFEELANLVVDGFPLFPPLATAVSTTCQIGLFDGDETAGQQRRLDGD